MLYKVVGIIGKSLFYLLTTIVVLWFVYIIVMASINTYCDCAKKLEKWWIINEKSMESLGKNNRE